MTREQWLLQRAEGVGSSDCPTILGLNPWQTRDELVGTKSGQFPPPDLSEKESVQWGIRLEPVVADHFASLHPELIVTNPGQYFIKRSEQYPWMQASPDRYALTDTGLLIPSEMKTTSAFMLKYWKDICGDFAPSEMARSQLHHQMIVEGEHCTHGWLCALIGGQRYLEFLVERCPFLSANIIHETKVFWDEVLEAKEALC